MNGDDVRRRRFFYAEAEAGLYDVSIHWVVPYYDLMRTTIQWTAAVAGQRAKRAAKPFTVLDVGAGTGNDTLDILKSNPDAHVVAVDLCEPMLEVLRTRLATEPDQSLASRCTLICADILSDFKTPAELIKQLPVNGRAQGFSLILSSLTVHHFEHDEKHRWYQLAAALAEREYGSVIIADLFAYSEPELTKSALEFDLQWMKQHFRSATIVDESKRESLLTAWQRHYREDNRLEAIEDSDLAIGQARMLQDAGFPEVYVPYRFSLSGVLVGGR